MTTRAEVLGALDEAIRQVQGAISARKHGRYHTYCTKTAKAAALLAGLPHLRDGAQVGARVWVLVDVFQGIVQDPQIFSDDKTAEAARDALLKKAGLSDEQPYNDDVEVHLYGPYIRQERGGWV